MTISSLMARLNVLEKELSDSKGGDDGDGDQDEFMRIKKQCTKSVADIRKIITERDELLEKQKGGSKETVEMSAKVRQQLRSLKENHGRLKELHATQAEKLRKKGKGPQPGEPDARAEIVDLISKHVQECEQLEKRRFGGGGASAAAAAAGARADLIGENMPPRRANKRTAEYTDLKDLDDPELDEGLKAMAAKDAELDADLDIISAGVGRLKNIALDMNEEIKMQNVMVDEITTKVDEATAHLQDLNKKLKDALDGAGGATMIIIRLVLFILLVAAAVYAYTLVK